MHFIHRGAMLVLTLLVSACQTPPHYWGANLPERSSLEGLVSQPAAFATKRSQEGSVQGKEKIVIVLSDNTLRHFQTQQERFKDGLSNLAVIGLRESKGQSLRAMQEMEPWVAALIQPLRSHFQVVGYADDLIEAFESGANQVVVLDVNLRLNDDLTEYVYRADYHLVWREQGAALWKRVESKGAWVIDGEKWWTAAEKMLHIRHRFALSAAEALAAGR